MKRILLGMGMSFLLLGACENSDDGNGNDDDGNGNDDDAPSTILLNIKDIMRSTYLWVDVAREKDVDLSAYDPSDHASLVALVRAYQSPADRFTFLLTRQAASVFDGTPTDAGILFRYLHDTMFVAYVEPNSPAEAQNIRRGMWVKSITRTGGETKTYTPPPAVLPGTLGPSSDGRGLANLGNFDGTVVLGERGSSTLRTLSFSSGVYELEGISVSRIFTVAGKKVGYFYYSSFLAARSVEEINDVFVEFQNEGVRDVIIDLRYNGGGSVAYARHLTASLFSPGANSVMFSYQYNDEFEEQLRRRGENLDILFPPDVVPLQAQRCFFLVDAGTASASELVINTLRPFSQVKVYIIGRTTVGKAVGSFRYHLPFLQGQSRSSIEAGHTHSFFPIIIRIVNSAGDGDYDAGFTPDHTTFDDVRMPLGDPKEAMLAAALYYIENNAWPTLPVAARRALERQPMISTRQLDGLQLPLLIDDRPPTHRP